MNEPWLQHYLETGPAEINVAPVPTPVEMINEALTTHAPRPALRSMGKTTNFGELNVLAERMTAWR